MGDILTLNLDGMITASMKRDGDRRVIDGDALRKKWNGLPQATRNAYSAEQREAIEGFIDQASAEQLATLPPMLAVSLMNEGQLSNRLRGLLEE